MFQHTDSFSMHTNKTQTPRHTAQKMDRNWPSVLRATVGFSHYVPFQWLNLIKCISDKCNVLNSGHNNHIGVCLLAPVARGT